MKIRRMMQIAINNVMAIEIEPKSYKSSIYGNVETLVREEIGKLLEGTDFFVKNNNSYSSYDSISGRYITIFKKDSKAELRIGFNVKLKITSAKTWKSSTKYTLKEIELYEMDFDDKELSDCFVEAEQSHQKYEIERKKCLENKRIKFIEKLELVLDAVKSNKEIPENINHYDFKNFLKDYTDLLAMNKGGNQS